MRTCVSYDKKIFIFNGAHEPQDSGRFIKSLTWILLSSIIYISQNICFNKVYFIDTDLAPNIVDINFQLFGTSGDRYDITMTPIICAHQLACIIILFIIPAKFHDPTNFVHRNNIILFSSKFIQNTPHAHVSYQIFRE
jgi:hypothetical protein